MNRNQIQMTAEQFTRLCERANGEATTTNKIDELVIKHDDDRVYSGTLTAEWSVDGVTLIQRESYDMTESSTGNRSYLEFGHTERFETKPLVMIVDTDGRETEIQYWDIMNDHSDMIDQEAVFDVSTMPDPIEY